MIRNGLVGGFNHLEKYEFVNGFRMMYPIYEMENIKFMFQTTNQDYINGPCSCSPGDQFPPLVPRCCASRFRRPHLGDSLEPVNWSMVGKHTMAHGHLLVIN